MRHPPLCRLWCCGSLQTASVFVGTASLLFTGLFLSQYMERELYQHSFYLSLLAIILCSVFLAASDVALIYGTHKRYPWLLTPWLVLHFVAFVALLVYLSLNFNVLEDQKIPPLAALVMLAYFYALVFAHYMEIRTGNGNASQESKEGNKDQCLIDLEANANADENDTGSNVNKCEDTFTQIALRKNDCSLLDESGEFAVPILPTPDEVIALPSTDWAFNTSNSKSVAHLDNLEEEQQQQKLLLPPAKSEPRILGQVDNTFSPFRSKSGSAQNGPKMKVFLPKSDQEDSSSSASSVEELPVSREDVVK